MTAATDRLSVGYVPEFDRDAAVGRQGELFSADIARALTDGSAEVKTDAKAFQTGRIYIEHACLKRDGWQPSGIATTHAEVVVYVLPNGNHSILIAGSVAAWRHVHSKASAAGWFRECSRGSHPTKGVTVPLKVLAAWMLEGAA